MYEQQAHNNGLKSDVNGLAFGNDWPAALKMK